MTATLESATRTMTYIEAISSALDHEMQRDDNVFLIGEDIATYGGAFKVTAGFMDKFGKERVIDTPIAESAIIGAGMGAALMGMRPVAEMQFADFISCGFNQLVNNVAKSHYRWGAAVPMVVRLPYGGGLGAGPFHSQCPEAWFFHVPGLKLVAPSTPADAKGLLSAAIRDDNPVLYFEHKKLYRHAKGEVPEGEHFLPIGDLRVATTGNDLSIVTWGYMTQLCVQVAEDLKQSQNINVEVLDLRTLLPYDRDAILESVAKTNRLLIVHEACLTGGIGGDISAHVVEHGFDLLDAPVRRLASLDTPVPYAPTLEAAFLPDELKIKQAVVDLLEY